MVPLLKTGVVVEPSCDGALVSGVVSEGVSPTKAGLETGSVGFAMGAKETETGEDGIATGGDELGKDGTGAETGEALVGEVGIPPAEREQPRFND